MGNLDNTEYTFTAQAAGLPAQTFTAVTVNLPDDYTYANVVLPRIIIEQLETVNSRGSIVDAAGVGKQVDGGIKAKITVTEEDHDIVFGTWTQDNCTEDCQFDSYFFVGKGTYTTVTLTPTARPTPDANAPNSDITVNYSVTSGGGAVNPVSQANLQDGIYTTQLTTGPEPGTNTVQISATAVYPIKWLKPDPDDTNGRAYLNEIEYKIDQNPSITPLTKTVYGIKGEIIDVVPAYIPLYPEGYVLEQAVINYRILPDTYEVVNTYMNLYEGNLPAGTLGAVGNINTGTAVIYQGAKFDPAKLYEVELVLDIGTEEVVRSEKAEVKVVAVELISCTPPNNNTSFTTLDSENDIHCIADVKPDNMDATYNSQIEWIITSTNGDTQDPAPQTGDDVNLSVTAPDAPDGRDSALRYSIKARLTIDQTTVETNPITIEQDTIDTVRQQYVDVDGYMGSIPQRNIFTTTEHPELNVQGSPAWIINWGVDLANMVSTLGITNITAAYRNPKWERNQGRDGNSFHVYGRAVDYNEGSSETNYNMAQTAIGTFPVENYLYDQNEIRYRVRDFPIWPEMPEGVTAYTHGHAAWNP